MFELMRLLQARLLYVSPVTDIDLEVVEINLL